MYVKECVVLRFKVKLTPPVKPTPTRHSGVLGGVCGREAVEFTDERAEQFYSGGRDIFAAQI